MITIHLLKNNRCCIPRLAEIWQEVLGKIWLPEVSIKMVEQNLQNSLNNESSNPKLPLTLVAFYNEIPVGIEKFTKL